MPNAAPPNTPGAAVVRNRDDDDRRRQGAIDQAVGVIVQGKTSCSMADPNTKLGIFKQALCGSHGGFVEVPRAPGFARQVSIAGLLEQFVDFCGNLLMGNQHRFARIDFRHAPGDFLVPGLGDGFGGIFRRTFQADDQAMDKFAALLR